MIKRTIFNVTQKVFADGAFCLTDCGWFSFALVQSEDSSYRFAQTLLIFKGSLHGSDSGEKKVGFFQQFNMSSPVDEIDKELNCV